MMNDIYVGHHEGYNDFDDVVNDKNNKGYITFEKKTKDNELFITMLINTEYIHGANFTIKDQIKYEGVIYDVVDQTVNYYFGRLSMYFVVKESGKQNETN